jgi:Asp-tRNA(Asn)/Glu-tRNA(Gln) amidotransferase A subunit family amidase
MERIDLYLAPSFSQTLLLTNLTGHPAVVVPNGFAQNDLPTSITFTGRLYDEATLLAVAKAYQDATDFHLKHPPLKK